MYRYSPLEKEFKRGSPGYCFSNSTSCPGWLTASWRTMRKDANRNPVRTSCRQHEIETVFLNVVSSLATLLSNPQLKQGMVPSASRRRDSGRSLRAGVKTGELPCDSDPALPGRLGHLHHLCVLTSRLKSCEYALRGALLPKPLDYRRTWIWALFLASKQG